MKKWSIFLFLSLVVVLYTAIPREKQYRFRVAYLSDIPSIQTQSTNNAFDILNQNFEYLGEGGQAYAYLSQDGQYVLKFFKRKHLKPKWYRKKGKLLRDVIAGYELAYNVDREGSGLIYVHLNSRNVINKTLVLQDRLAISHTINLDEIPFVIQKKATPFNEVLNDYLSNGNIRMAKLRIRQILDLYARHFHQGIDNHGSGVIHNNGFVGDIPIFIDLGKFSGDPKLLEPQVFKKRIEKVASIIMAWIKKQYPEHHAELEKDIQETL